MFAKQIDKILCGPSSLPSWQKDDRLFFKKN
jgi:hypothetical protein